VRQQRERILRAAPVVRLLLEGEDVEAAVLPGDLGDDPGDVAGAGCSGKVAAPQRHVKIGMLAAREAGDAERAERGCHERQQHHRPSLAIACEHGPRLCADADADVVLPGTHQVEALIRRKDLLRGFERSPLALYRAKVIEDLDAHGRPCGRCNGAHGLVSDRCGHRHR
jgi:hypothetical protein